MGKGCWYVWSRNTMDLLLQIEDWNWIIGTVLLSFSSSILFVEKTSHHRKCKLKKQKTQSSWINGFFLQCDGLENRMSVTLFFFKFSLKTKKKRTEWLMSAGENRQTCENRDTLMLEYSPYVYIRVENENQSLWFAAAVPVCWLRCAYSSVFVIKPVIIAWKAQSGATCQWQHFRTAPEN